MNVGSLEFLLLFLPVVWVLHWALPRRPTYQNAAVTLASWLFYVTWTPRLLAILALTTLVHWGAVVLMHRHRERPGRLRAVFWLAVAYDVGQLLGFKYLGFFAESLNALLLSAGLGDQLPVLRFVLPLGISFWTLQHIAYLIDVFYGREPAEERPTLLAYAAFASFFGQVVSGPIPRGRELLPQLAAPRRLTAALVASGAGAFLLGYVLKFFIGESWGRYMVDPVFADPGAYSPIGLSLGAFGYTLQVFGDFAGYSIMAIGLGRLFGLELPVNFRYPFFSKDMMEFWRRWHITLNRFLFDYLYWPLVGSRGWWRARFDLGFLMIFGLSGLWHGATWNFVLWGVIHGVGLAVHRRWDVLYRGLCKRDRAWVARRRTRRYAAAAWAITQGFFVLSLIPFRAPDLGTTGAVFSGLLAGGGALHHPLSGKPLAAVAVASSLALLVGYHLLELERGRPWRARLLTMPAPVRGVAYGLLLVWLALFMPVGGGTFIYAQF